MNEEERGWALMAQKESRISYWHARHDVRREIARKYQEHAAYFAAVARRSMGLES